MKPYKSKRWPDTKRISNIPEARTAEEAGGILIPLQFNIPQGENGGCGAPTHVEGTNGGKMPCGALLTRFGVTAPYYCALCKPSKID